MFSLSVFFWRRSQTSDTFICKYLCVSLKPRTSKDVTTVPSLHLININLISPEVVSVHISRCLTNIHCLSEFRGCLTEIQRRSTTCTWLLCLWGFSWSGSLLPPFQVLPLAIHLSYKLYHHFRVLLIASPWWCLVCFSVLCISHKFVAGCRVLIRFKFNLPWQDFFFGCLSLLMLCANSYPFGRGCYVVTFKFCPSFFGYQLECFYKKKHPLINYWLPGGTLFIGQARQMLDSFPLFTGFRMMSCL